MSAVCIVESFAETEISGCLFQPRMINIASPTYTVFSLKMPELVDFFLRISNISMSRGVYILALLISLNMLSAAAPSRSHAGGKEISPESGFGGLIDCLWWNFVPSLGKFYKTPISLLRKRADFETEKMEQAMINASPVACEEFFLYLERIFSISLIDFKTMIEAFHSEMRKGLSGRESSLKMIPSFVDKPKGNEMGKFLALDLGGTNFRVLAVNLDGKGNAAISAAGKFVIPKKDMRGTGVRLFDFIAGCIDSFLEENHIDENKIYDLAFTFSFPVEQKSIASGNLIAWTKGFTAIGVQGEDVVNLLTEALRRKNINCINVTALANDTVGTLVAGSYADSTCDLGVILGTGTNACYREKIANITKLRGYDPHGHMIVNTEWGNFDKVRFTSYDRFLDETSVNPGSMHLEKMVSGMYLGEITRLVLMDLIGRGLIFENEPHAAQNFKTKDSLKTEAMSCIEVDKTECLDEVNVFFETHGISNIAYSDKTSMKRLCRIVSARAAGLGAGAISAVLTWIDPELEDRHTVGIDGSLFEKYPGFRIKMIDVLNKLYGEKAEKIELVHSKDGSGKGAAIIAAVAASPGV